jgi:pSer/pThr/pTyr-binding forkhead associated (FHA) protein
MQHILVRHTSGTRSNQVDEFQADGFKEILVGRDESSSVRFDPDREDLVSRNHLRIYSDPANPGCLLVSDLQSRNGTFLNGQRINTPTRIHHGDSVQLGPGGPAFRLELDPPPASVARPTRTLSQSESAALAGVLAKPTRATNVPDLSSPRPIGRATVERMLDDNFGRVKKESGKTLWVGIAAVIMIAAVGLGSYLYLRHAAIESANRAQEQQLLLLQMAQVVKQQPSDDAAVRAQMDKLSGDLKKIMAQNQSLRQSAAEAPGTAAPEAQQTQQYPSSDYNAGLAQATQLYKTNDFAKAYAECVRISGIDPSRWEGYYIAGLSAEALNDPQNAQTAYQYAFAQAPDAAKPTISQRVNAIQGSSGGQAN